MYILYKTTNLINNTYYIGKHKQKDGYSHNEFDGYLGSGIRLQHAIKKYGKDNFVRETLEYSEHHSDISDSELNYITEDLIKDVNCYNIGKGGQGGDIKSDKAKEELRALLISDNPMHKIKKDKVKFDEWKKKVSIGTKNGMKASENYKNAMIKQREKFNSDANPGKNKSAETCKRISKAKKGKPSLKGKDSPMYGKRWTLTEEKRSNIAEGIRNARENEINFCTLCNITIKTNGNWARHLKGKKHLSKVISLVSDSDSL